MRSATPDSALRFYLIFFAKLVAVYTSWKIFEFIIGIESQPIEERFFPKLSTLWEWLNQQLRTALLHCTGLILSLLGFQYLITEGNYIINIIGYRGVAVGNYCLAFQFMYFFTCLMLLSPLPILAKLWSIPLGIIIIQGLNVFRFVGLNLLIVYYPNLVGHLHDYVFNVAVLLFILIYFWMTQKISK